MPAFLVYALLHRHLRRERASWRAVTGQKEKEPDRVWKAKVAFLRTRAEIAERFEHA
jgi:hypothetical protein